MVVLAREAEKPAELPLPGPAPRRLLQPLRRIFLELPRGLLLLRRRAKGNLFAIWCRRRRLGLHLLARRWIFMLDFSDAWGLG